MSVSFLAMDSSIKLYVWCIIVTPSSYGSSTSEDGFVLMRSSLPYATRKFCVEMAKHWLHTATYDVPNGAKLHIVVEERSI